MIFSKNSSFLTIINAFSVLFFFTTIVPRSQSECINRCVLQETLAMQQHQCLNYYSLVTRNLLHEIVSNQAKIFDNSDYDSHRLHHSSSLSSNQSDDEKVKFCQHRSYLDYYRFVLARRKCRHICKRNCLESVYTTTMDISTSEDVDFMNNDEIVTRIIIKANHEMVQKIKHERQMSLFEFIGYLGGHAHIWLGLSVIQFYGAISRVLIRFRYYLEKFLTCYHDRMKNRPKNIQITN